MGRPGACATMTSVAIEAMRHRPEFCDIVALQQSPDMQMRQSLYESQQTTVAKLKTLSASTQKLQGFIRGPCYKCRLPLLRILSRGDVCWRQRDGQSARRHPSLAQPNYPPHTEFTPHPQFELKSAVHSINPHLFHPLIPSEGPFRNQCKIVTFGAASPGSVGFLGGCGGLIIIRISVLTLFEKLFYNFYYNRTTVQQRASFFRPIPFTDQFQTQSLQIKSFCVYFLDPVGGCSLCSL